MFRAHRVHTLKRFVSKKSLGRWISAAAIATRLGMPLE